MPTALALADSIPADLPEHTISGALQAASAIREGNVALAQKRVDGLGSQGVDVPLAAMLDAWLIAAGPHRDPAAIARALGRVSDFGVVQTLHAALIADYVGDRDLAAIDYAALAQSRESPRLAVFARDYYRRTGQSELARDAVAGLPRTSDGLVFASIEANKVTSPKPTLAFGTAEAFYDVAELLLDAEHPDIALFYARIAAYLDPASADMRFLLGEIEQAQGRYAEAARDFASAPPSSAFADLGQMDAALDYERAGNRAKGVEIARALVAREPAEVEPKTILADMLRRQGRFVEAASLYSDCLNALPPNDPRRGTLLLSRAIAYDRAGKTQAAETDLTTAVALTPDQPLTLNYLGYFWVSRGEHLDEARAMLQKAYALMPDDPAIADSLGWAEYTLGDFTHAAKTLEQAVIGSPADSTLNAHLGDAYWRVGRLREARAQWRRALIDASSADAAALREKLRDGLPEVQATLVAKHAALETP